MSGGALTRLRLLHVRVRSSFGRIFAIWSYGGNAQSSSLSVATPNTASITTRFSGTSSDIIHSLAGLPPGAAQQLPAYIGQHVADLVEPARGFGTAQRRPLPFPIFDAGDQAGDVGNRGHSPSSRIRRIGRLLALSMPVSSSTLPGRPPLWLLAGTTSSVEAMMEEGPMVKSRGFKPTEEAKCHGRAKPGAVIC
jgi:hypothetical protein